MADQQNTISFFSEVKWRSGLDLELSLKKTEGVMLPRLMDVMVDIGS